MAARLAMDFGSIHSKGKQSLTILDRYVIKAVLAGSLVALLLLTSVNVVIDFVEEANNVGKPGFSFLYAVLSTLLTIPRRIYEFFPTAVLLGGLMSLGSLSAHNELVVMRVSGVSVFRLLGAVFMAGLLLVSLAFIFGEYVAPASEQRRQSLKTPSQSKHIGLKTRDGLWVRDGNRFINVNQVYTDYRLGNIWIYEMTEDLRLKVSVFAQSAVYVGDHWQVNGIRRSTVTHDGVATEHRQQERWERLLSPDLFDVIVIEPRKMSARKLAKYVEYLKRNELDSVRYELAFWSRFTIPLSGLLLLLMVTPYAITPSRTSSVGQRLFIGTLIGVTFHTINQAMLHLGLVYELPPFLGATLPLFLVMGLIAVAILRVR